MHEQMDRREGAPEKRNIAARSRAASSPKGSGLKQTQADRENQPNLRVDHFNTHDMTAVRDSDKEARLPSTYTAWWPPRGRGRYLSSFTENSTTTKGRHRVLLSTHLLCCFSP